MSTTTERRVFEFGGFRLDAAQRQLFGPDGAPVQLPSRAFDVLLFMVERPGDRLDKATLMNAVWPRAVVEEGNLTQCIFALRRALGDTVGEHRFIVTIPGRGYQFAARVQAEDVLPTEAPVSLSAIPVASHDAPDADPIVATPGNGLRTRTLWLAGSIATLLVVTLLGYLFWLRAAPQDSTAEALEATAATSPPTIAVMPFADLSPAGDMEYFADGIAEELIANLAKVRSLRVVGRRSSLLLKGGDEDARAIGEKLKVENILEGSVRKEGERIRISAQLVRAKDGYSLWAETYDRALDDVLNIQGAIAREVVAALPIVQQTQGSPDRAALDTNLTGNAEAYRAYLRGLYFTRRDTAADLPRARDEFLRAVELDPQFAKAHVYLARTYNWMSYRTGNSAHLRSLAYAANGRALTLDPKLADLWWMHYFTGRENVPFADRSTRLERILAASPDDAEVMVELARWYSRLGRFADALQMIERAYLADPLWPGSIGTLAIASYRWNGDRQRMLTLLDELERVAPGSTLPSGMRAELALVEGRALDWDHWVARSVEVAPLDLPVQGYLSLDYSNLGEIDAALYHARLCQQITPQNAAGWYNIAHIQLFSGNIAAARATVQEAAALHPEDFLTRRARAELQYFTGDCAGSIESIVLGQPELGQPPVALDVVHDADSVPMLVWCLRKQGNAARVSEIMHAFDIQFVSTVATAGQGDRALGRLPPMRPTLSLEGLRARMAAAVGDRSRLISHLDALARTRSMVFAFSPHEPMIQPYLADPEVTALLGTLEARRAEWRKVLPKASMRVPIPGITGASQGGAVTGGTERSN
jgi:TolB-like protein/DNA-binding winged helix-turn-helix (wHTH) protein/Flp pilus assembly protein TadD